MKIGSNSLGEALTALNLKQGDHVDLFNFLIRTRDDLSEFMEEFYTGHALKDMFKYKLYKRERNRMTFEEFDKAYQEDRKKALEVLFQEPITISQVEYLSSYSMSHKQLYMKLEKNSSQSYLRLVKGRNAEAKKHSDDFLLSF